MGNVSCTLCHAAWAMARPKFLFMASALCSLFLVHSFAADSETTSLLLQPNSCVFPCDCDPKDRGIFIFFPFPQSFVYQQKDCKECIAISLSSDALICWEHSALSHLLQVGNLTSSYRFYLSRANCQKWWALSVLQRICDHTNTSDDGLCGYDSYQ